MWGEACLKECEVLSFVSRLEFYDMLRMTVVDCYESRLRVF